MSPCVVDYVFINLPKCYNFLKKLSNFFIYMTAQNSSEKDVWIHYKWSGKYTVGSVHQEYQFHYFRDYCVHESTEKDVVKIE